jgi:uncharacterized protein (TIGR03067 family)
MISLMPLLATSLLIATASPANTGTEKGRDEIQGRWKSTPTAGLRVSLDDLTGDGGAVYSLFIVNVAAGKELEVKGNKLTFADSGKKIELLLTLDPTRTPKTIIARTGENKFVFQGIYAISNGSLSLCVSRKGFPTEFKNKSGVLLLKFQRIEKH